MAIQPIDLQTLYSQMDKVSKNVAYQEKGVYLNRDVHQADQQKKIDEQHKAIEKAQKEDKDAGKVKERQENRQQSSEKREEERKNEEQTVPAEPEVIYEWIKDPDVGNHIDISS